MTRIVIAPDKFKGTLTAEQVAEAVARGIGRVRPAAQCALVPVADGGDGTLAVAQHAGFEVAPLRAAGPLGATTDTCFVRRGDEAVIEMAQVCGLAMLGDRRDPLRATSRGLGEVIGAALDAGCRRIVVGIGGSASTDGGAGMVAALGGRISAADTGVPDGGAALADVDALDLTGLHPALASAELLIACDVDNPLTGPTGAARVFGPQKGAAPQEVTQLENALSHWADLVASTIGADYRNVPGAGAAGGVGFAATALLGATLRRGAPILFDLIGLPAAMVGADLVITGEGCLDEQTLHGKAPSAVADLAAAQGVPTVAVCGSCRLDGVGLQRLRVRAAYDLMSVAGDRNEALRDGERLLERLGERIAREHL